MGKLKKINRKLSRPRTRLLIIVAVALIAGIGSYLFVASMNSHQPVSVGKTAMQGHDAYAGIKKEDIESRGLLWEIGFNQEEVPIAALVRIDSIDGGRNYNPIYKRYVVAETYGKMTVLKVYKGDVEIDQELTYSRFGGIITAQEYSDALNAPGSEETYLHGLGPAKKKYVKAFVVDDIDVEVGKKYLAFLTPQTSRDGKHQEYAITGAQFGFREARVSGAEVTVLNYGTGKWVSASSIVELH